MINITFTRYFLQHSPSHLTKCEGHQAIMSREDSMEDFHRVNEVNKYEKIFACNRPSSCQDGILDVVSVRGTFHLGQIRVGLSNATRVCQASEIKVIIKKKVAVQIDGEPWRQEACTIKITRKQEPAVMLHRSAHESGGMETEMAKLLDWAEDREIIDRNVHDILMKEFSRRIESKTRKRRVKSQENLMVSLKRAVLS
jgi:Diacylglycerol kinase accessory domain